MKWKKGLAVLLVFLFCFQLCACGKSTSTNEAGSEEEKASSEGKEIITYGGVVIAPEVKQAIIRFNKLNPDVEIQIKDYGEEAGYDADTAITQMNLDILSGSAPDILALPIKFSLGLYAQKGVLEDLYPYIDADETLARETFLPNILTAYENDGKLYALPVSFELSTLMGAKSVLGEETGWTVDEMIAFADSCDPGSSIFAKASKTGVMEVCMTANWDKFIDWENKESGFDREEYKKILEFCNRFAPDESYVENAKYRQRIAEGDMFLFTANLYSGTDGGLYSSLFGEEVVFKGYPTEDGCGSLLMSYTTTAINARSQHKESAWKFVSSLLQPDVFEGNTMVRGFSVRQDVLEKQLAECVSEVAQIPYSIGEDFTVELKPATQEFADELRDLIESADTISNYDYSVMSILVEEAGMYFSGSKTADQVADVAENRIQMYLNEMR